MFSTWISGLLCVVFLFYGPLVLATNGEGYLAGAEGYLQAGEVESAVIQLKKALQQDPENAQARFRLGEIYLMLKDGPAAVKELGLAHQMGIDTTQVLVPLGRALLLKNSPQRVLDEINAPEEAPTGLKAEVLALRGRAELSLGRLSEAKNILNEAQYLDGNSVTVQLELARIAILEREYDTANASIQRALNVEPENVDAWLIRGELARQNGDLVGAKDAFSHVLHLHIDNPIARLGRAAVEIALKEYSTATYDVAVVLDQYPRMAIANHLRAILAYYNKDVTATDKYLRQVFTEMPHHLPSNLLIGASLYKQRKFEQALPHLERYVNNISGNLAARKLLAATYLRLGEPQTAVAVLEAGAERVEDDAQWLALLSNAYSQAGDTNKATEWLKKAVAVSPNMASLRNLLAVNHLRRGELTQAVRELLTAVDLGQDVLQSGVLLIFAYLRKQELDRAQSVAETLIQEVPDDPLPYSLLGVIYLERNRTDSARHQFEKAITLSPDHHAAAINLARLDVAAGDFGLAAKRLQTILEQDQFHVGTMLALLDIARHHGRVMDVQRWLERIYERNPGAAWSGLALARHHWLQGDHLAAVGVARQLLRTHPENTQVLELLGSVRMAMGEYANAAESFQAAVYLRPDIPKFLWQLAAAQAAAASYYSAIASLEKALAMQPDYLPAQMALVRLRQRTHRLQEGLELAREIQQQRPQNPQGYMLEGDIHMTAKEFEKAAKSYTESYARKKTPEIATKLFQAYWREGDRQTALESLEEWLAERPEDLKARKLLAQAYLLVDHPDAVIERDQAIVEGELGNAVALNKSSEVEKYSIIDTAKSLLDSASSYNNSFDSNGDPFDPSDPAYPSFKDIQKDLNALDGISQLDPADLITELTALRNVIVDLPGESNTSSGFVPWPIGTEWIRTPRTVYPRIRQQ